MQVLLHPVPNKALGALLLCIGLALFFIPWDTVKHRIMGRRTTSDAIRLYGAAAESRLTPSFEKAGVAYPPEKVVLLAFKQEARVELWAGRGSNLAHIRDYPILAASGDPGPKKQEGDRQVPEGVYRIEGLNPNSGYHLSMKVDYPNERDRTVATAESRDNLGGDIFIHGSNVSIGCLAMGDPAIEELFTLAAKTGYAKVEVVIAPCDFRVNSMDCAPIPDETTRELYVQLQDVLMRFPVTEPAT